MEGIDAHKERLAHAARGSSAVLPAADTVAVVEVGMLADATDMVAMVRAISATPIPPLRATTSGLAMEIDILVYSWRAANIGPSAYPAKPSTGTTNGDPASPIA